MADQPATDAFRELIARDLMAERPAPQLLSGGNADRRDQLARTSWRINLPDGRPARLILGSDLAGLARKHTAFARVCPALIPAPVFHQPLSFGEAFAEVFFDGVSLESAARDRPAHAQAAFARVCVELAAVIQPSTESARLAEWRAWTNAVESLEFWTPVEKQSLRDLLWPRLYPLLSSAAPVTRWTNGDFTSTNILLDQRGGPCLIDCEFAGETHFFAEDAVRFYTLSPAGREWPDLFSASLPRPGPAWHLYFWLRQLALESAHNSAAYLARTRPGRLGVIRRLAEQILDCQLAGWSVEAVPVHHALEVARWGKGAEPALHLSGWCHIPAVTALRSFVVTHGNRLLAETAPAARPDVQAHFAGAPGARAPGFTLAIPLPERDARLVLSALTADGFLLPFYSFQAGDLPGRGPWVKDYTRWAALYDPDPMTSAAETPGPLFSILLPVYETPPDFLRACLESVQKQHYPRWELCVVDDGSPSAGVPALLREFAAADHRIRVQHRATNGGIARATNDALALAAGDFILLLDHDDLLRPHALAEFARLLQREPTLDAVYSDEDKITAGGQRVMPFLKPDFSPEFLLGVMYVGHALCVRTAVARAAGGFDPAFDGVQDYEFFLRVTEQTRRIAHVPRILYHWRQSPASSALHGNIKGDMDEKQAAAVRAHLHRQGRTERVAAWGGHRLQLHPTTVPSVEIIHPAVGEEPLAALRKAAKASAAEVLVLLAVEPQHLGEHWWQELAGLAVRPDSGLIAPLLLSREGWVLESGRTVGAHGAVPLMRGFEPAGDGYNGSLPCCREVAAVSPVCFAVQRQRVLTALAAVPQDENWLAVCLRWRAGGLFHRVCPTAQIQLAASWRDPIQPTGTAQAPDPFFNPHFDARRADYSLARPPSHLSPVLWHLDAPPAAVLSSGCLIVRGWGFAANGRPFRAIRLRTSGLALSGVVGLPRPDVKDTLPEAPDENTGFEIRGTLPGGRITLCLEAQLADGTWWQLLARTVEVKRQLLPLWLGGGDWQELMFFQMPAHMAYPAREIKMEKFPPPGRPEGQPKFSIVTPSYQQGHFLGETMRSVLAQPGVACDYVVQDGGSTDGSAGLIQQCAGRLHAWASAPDQGQADAIAQGFAKTTGAPDDVMAWINSDDFYLPGTLAYVAGYFAQHPEVDVLYGNRIVVNEESQEIARWFLPKHDGEVLRLNDFVPQETLFWRRRIWDKVGGLDTSFKFALDWDLLLRFQAAGARIMRVPYFLACFRVHAAQKTSALMHSTGQKEITRLRERTHGRPFPPQELETHPRLLRYLRRSAFIEFLWKLGIRAP